MLLRCRKYRLNQRGLSGARTAGNDQKSRLHGIFHGFLLLVCQRQLMLPFKLLNCQCLAAQIRSPQESLHPLAGLRLRLIQRRPVQEQLIAPDHRRNLSNFRRFQNRLPHQLLFLTEQLRRALAGGSCGTQQCPRKKSQTAHERPR